MKKNLFSPEMNYCRKVSVQYFLDGSLMCYGKCKLGRGAYQCFTEVFVTALEVPDLIGGQLEPNLLLFGHRSVLVNVFHFAICGGFNLILIKLPEP